MNKRPIVTKEMWNEQQRAEDFQHMLDQARNKRNSALRELEQVQEDKGVITDELEPTHKGGQPILRAIPDQPAPEEVEKAPTPAEIAASAVASIAAAAKLMAAEADAAASAVEVLAKMLRADANEFSAEINKLSGLYCERISGYLSEVASIQSSFQEKKEAIIKAAQTNGPILIAASRSE